MKRFTIGAVLAVVAMLSLAGLAEARWDDIKSQNTVYKGKQRYQKGVHFVDTVLVDEKITIGDTLTTDGDGVITKPGSFSANADSTVTLVGATTASAAFTASSIATFDSVTTQDFSGITTMGQGGDGLDTVAIAGVVATDAVIATSQDTLCSVRAWAGTDSTFYQFPWTIVKDVQWMVVRPK